MKLGHVSFLHVHNNVFFPGRRMNCPEELVSKPMMHRANFALPPENRKVDHGS